MNPIFGQGGLERQPPDHARPAGAPPLAVLALVAAGVAFGYAFAPRAVLTPSVTRVEVRREVAECYLPPFPDQQPAPAPLCRGSYGGECGGIGTVCYRQWQIDDYLRSCGSTQDWAVEFWSQCGGGGR
jgi:hypothetical protein